MRPPATKLQATQPLIRRWRCGCPKFGRCGILRPSSNRNRPTSISRPRLTPSVANFVLPIAKARYAKSLGRAAGLSPAIPSARSLTFPWWLLIRRNPVRPMVLHFRVERGHRSIRGQMHDFSGCPGNRRPQRVQRPFLLTISARQSGTVFQKNPPSTPIECFICNRWRDTGNLSQIGHYPNVLLSCRHRCSGKRTLHDSHIPTI